MKRLLKFKIKTFFSNLWFKYVKKPYLVYLEQRKEDFFKKNVIKAFHKQFGVHPDEVKAQIIANEKVYWGKKPNVKFTHTEYQEFLREELKKSAKPNNSIPCFYEPEIIDIHNESVIGKNGKSLNEIKLEERKNDENTLIKQILRREFAPKKVK